MVNKKQYLDIIRRDLNNTEMTDKEMINHLLSFCDTVETANFIKGNIVFPYGEDLAKNREGVFRYNLERYKIYLLRIFELFD